MTNPIIVLGAGIAGLGAAYKLSKENQCIIVLEKDDTYGGLCGNFTIDGFRFDLMGLHDVETMNAIRSAMDAIDSRILLYGEGWDMGIGLASEQKAKKDNAALLPRIGFFNDNSRDAVKGAEVYGHISK